MEFVLDNISEITINVGSIFVKYKDGATHLIETDESDVSLLPNDDGQ
jgi:hypothetical protein